MHLAAFHPTGTAAAGSDAARHPTGPDGRLRGVEGVWIGDASAFPTSSGTNPMVSIMALAHRTAEAIAADAGASPAQPTRAAQPA